MHALGANLILTAFVSDDAPILCDADHDPEHRRRFDFPYNFQPSLQHSQSVIATWNKERRANKRFAFAVRDATTNALLGGCELLPINEGTANVSYWTHPAHRRNGIATRAVALLKNIALTEFGFRRLEVVIDPDNIGSRRVADRNGFAGVGMRDGRMVYSLMLKP